MFRILRPYQVAIDGAIALVYFFFATQLAVYGFGEFFLVTVLTAALVLRRVSPGLALALAWSAALAQMYVFDFPPTYLDLAILAVVYTSAAYGGRLVKWFGLASVGLGAILGSLYLVVSEQGFQFGFNFSTATVADLSGAMLQFAFLFIAMLVLLGLPWTAGLLVRTRIAARESKAAQLAAQREAEIAEQGVIVEQERNRIARDMHDVVAHSLAVVIAQADGARYARAGDPAAVDTALTAISSTARDALADVRLLLGQLRHSQAAGPQPTLVDLDRLLDQLRASGLLINHTSSGTALSLGSGAQLAVYRVVQEALTNVLRHGDVTQPVQVDFTWTTTHLEIIITSQLTSSPHTGELRLGHGLAGMKERAVLAGGELTAGPQGNHFVVAASVPSSGRMVRA